MQASLAQMFNETSAEAREAFPSELKNLVVLLFPSSDTPVYVSPETADQLTKNTAAVKAAIAGLASYMRSLNGAGVAFASYDLGGANVKLVALDENVRGLFSPGYTKEMRAVFVLDHELGHHVVRYGHYDSTLRYQHLAESAADAYAMIRHIQRFGKDTDLCVQPIASRNARSIVLFSDAAHYTTDALQKVIEISEGTDVSALSLRETAELAAGVAWDCHMDGRTLQKICDAFLPVCSASRAYIGNDRDVTGKLYREDTATYELLCKSVLSVMEKHRDDLDIFKAGQRFLEGFPAMEKIVKAETKTSFRPSPF